MIPVYNQGDPRWSKNLLGNSNLTIGRWGCTMTCISMALKRYGIDMTPDVLASKMHKAGAIMDDGNLLWSGIPKVTDGKVFFHWRGSSTIDKEARFSPETPERILQRIKDLVSMGHPVLLNIDNIGGDNRPDHWVLAVESKAHGLLIHDPDGGKAMLFQEKYGDELTGIYGYAVLIGTPLEAPETSSRVERNAGIALWKAKAMQAAYIKGDRETVATYARETVDTLI